MASIAVGENVSGVGISNSRLESQRTGWRHGTGDAYVAGHCAGTSAMVGIGVRLRDPRKRAN